MKNFWNFCKSFPHMVDWWWIFCLNKFKSFISFHFLQFHKHDLTLARTMGDRLGEAKASGNLGNTLKVMGKFEEAVICCRKHLDICQEHSDKIGIGRALYNLGNVYHAKVSFVELPFSSHCSTEITTFGLMIFASTYWESLAFTPINNVIY